MAHDFDTILKANPAFLGLERHLGKRCGWGVAGSRYDEDNLKRAGIHNTSMAYNGCPNFSEAAYPDTEAARRLDEIKIRGRIVVCLARLVPPKRFDLFYAAAERLPQYQFVWIGNRMPIEKALPNFHAFGEIPTMAALIPKCDLLYHPPNYEGLPMSVLEAMSCGVPPVVSPVGGLIEILDGTCGSTVQNIPVEIARVIDSLLTDPVHLNAIGDEARRIFQARFTVRPPRPLPIPGLQYCVRRTHG